MLSEEKSLRAILSGRFDRDELVQQIHTDVGLRDEAIQLMLQIEQPYGWRAAWVMKEYFRMHKSQVYRYLNRILKLILNTDDSHQRELLHIVEVAELDDEQEGMLFDICLTLWESIGKKGSVRHVSFNLLARIIKKYPELKNEIQHLVTEEYLEPLSPGIRKAVEKEIGRVLKA
jgi:hypothetical protein